MGGSGEGILIHEKIADGEEPQFPWGAGDPAGLGLWPTLSNIIGTGTGSPDDGVSGWPKYNRKGFINRLRSSNHRRQSLC